MSLLPELVACLPNTMQTLTKFLPTELDGGASVFTTAKLSFSYHPVYFDHRGFPCDRYPDQMLPQPPAVAMHAASLDA